MTAGSLPEGLVERCDTVLQTVEACPVCAAKPGAIPSLDWDRDCAYCRSIALRAVLAVAEPAIREQALRDVRKAATDVDMCMARLPRAGAYRVETEELFTLLRLCGLSWPRPIGGNGGTS